MYANTQPNKSAEPSRLQNNLQANPDHALHLPQVKQTVSPPLMTAQTYFKDMLTFMHTQCTDKRLTPAAQLLLHTLCILANRNYWTYPFEASREELKRITHISSDETINRAKRQLKNLGYIDFTGKPSRFTIYRPTAQKAAHESANARPPKTPVTHTTTQSNHTLNSEATRERPVTVSDHVQHSGAAKEHLATDNAAFRTQLKRLAELRKLPDFKL